MIDRCKRQDDSIRPCLWMTYRRSRVYTIRVSFVTVVTGVVHVEMPHRPPRWLNLEVLVLLPKPVGLNIPVDPLRV